MEASLNSEHIMCVYCQSTGKCLVFPVAQLGIVPWSSCPPNLSTLYWYSCRLSYAYFLAIAIATFVFVGLLLSCICVLCVLRRRRCGRADLTKTAAAAFSSSPSLRPFLAYHYPRRLVRCVASFANSTLKKRRKIFIMVHFRGSH
ncbi:unnamed protein product [Taenia asiatica]|uniref:Uncharacterized protein n=1 Tax=Taenia asiatica TaxID=60517 RepID=A0A0R3W5V0_TAEAS|nr:unnamed protein product [Taenia asiatica]